MCPGGKRLLLRRTDLSVYLSPPPSLPPSLPHLQKPHRLRCFTQPMKCLKDTESVSPHGHGFLSAGLPEGTRLSLSISCMHSSSAAWIYGGLVASMYNQQTETDSTHSHTCQPGASRLFYVLLVCSSIGT